jgi:hypothetical protein
MSIDTLQEFDGLANRNKSPNHVLVATKELPKQMKRKNFATPTPPLSQPYFEGSVRLPFTLPKMGLGSPLGFLKIQSSIAGVKTLRLEVFFIPLERS